MQRTVSSIAALCAVVILFAPSLKVRFFLSDMIVLYLPTLTLALCAVFAHIARPGTVGLRLRFALAFALLFCAPLFAFAIGGFDETGLLYRVLINCSVGALIVLYPWDRSALDTTLIGMIAFGLALALSTILFYRTSGDYSGMAEGVKNGYLNVTFSIGLACIACLYRIVERLNALSLVLFAICWIGLAMSLGRGSLLFCAVVSALYLLVVMSSRLVTFGRGGKAIVSVLALAFVPVVVAQVMSIERSAGRFAVLFSDLDSEAGVAGRTVLYKAAVERILGAPLGGNGLGAYFGEGENIEGHPHNIVLQFGIDAGLIGIAVITLFLLIVARCLIYSRGKTGARSRNLVYAVGALFAFMLLSYMKSHDAYIGREMYVLSALPIALAASTRAAVRRAASRRASPRARARVRRRLASASR